MRIQPKRWAGILCLTVLIIFIMDAKIVLFAAKEGVDLCIQSIIPSLFPFLLLSNIVSNALSGDHIPLISNFTKNIGIPRGAETVILLGILSGYPVGAQNINAMYKKHMIRQKTAHRLLAFCSNAGPAFIFGMLSPLFDDKAPLWLLWAIHIVSAFVVSLVFSERTSEICDVPRNSKAAFTECMDQALRSMAIICGWVIVFHVIIVFLEKWILWLFPETLSILLSGLLEISNGCIMLKNIPIQGMRFILSAFFLGIGGICVSMQTLSVTRECGTGLYFPGKILQTALSVLMAYICQYIIFSNADRYKNGLLPAICLISVGIIVFIYCKIKNKYSISIK